MTKTYQLFLFLILLNTLAAILVVYQNFSYRLLQGHIQAERDSKEKIHRMIAQDDLELQALSSGLFLEEIAVEKGFHFPAPEDLREL